MNSCFSSFTKTSSLAFGLLLAGTAAFAAPVTPTFDSFGSLPSATFGGTGIPNDRVAITNSGGVTLGLTATGRFSNPTVNDDGAGTYFAVTGADSNPAYARWNFDFYASNASATTVYLRLLWDLNPGVATDLSLLGNSGLFTLASGATAQNSWNLGMGFLGGGFNPNLAGEYSFALILSDSAGAELARSAINVNTSNVPEASSTGLLSIVALAALVGFAGMSRRRRSA